MSFCDGSGAPGGSGATGYEPNPELQLQVFRDLQVPHPGACQEVPVLRHCSVCRQPGAQAVCDWCGGTVHGACSYQGEGFVLCLTDFQSMQLQFGAHQMQQREWLTMRLEQARQHRRAQLDFEARRLAAQASDVVGRSAQWTGAAVGASAAIAARAVGSLTSGAVSGATAAWGATSGRISPSRERPEPSRPLGSEPREAARPLELSSELPPDG